MDQVYDEPNNHSQNRLSSSEDLGHHDDDERWPESDTRVLSHAHSPETAHLTTEQTSRFLIETRSRRSLWPGFTAVVTLLLCASIAIVVKVFSPKKGMNPSIKHGFETITTALLIFLGLNFNASEFGGMERL